MHNNSLLFLKEFLRFKNLLKNHYGMNYIFMKKKYHII